MASGVLDGDDRLFYSPFDDEDWAIVGLLADGRPGVHYDDQDSA